MESRQPTNLVRVTWVLVLVVGIPLVCGGAALHILRRPWERMGDGARPTELERLVEHYRPRVDALHRHEEERGYAPARLESLVPDYLTERP